MKKRQRKKNHKTEWRMLWARVMRHAKDERDFYRSADMGELMDQTVIIPREIEATIKHCDKEWEFSA